MTESLPDGLACGKHEIFQVEPTDDTPRVVIDFYTEYGDEGVASFTVLEEDVPPERFWIDVRTLRAFLSHFDKRVKEKAGGR